MGRTDETSRRTAPQGRAPAPSEDGAAPLSRRQRMLVIASLYLVSDIGYSFFFGALGTILLARGVSLGTVALINLLTMVYFGRFLVGPLVDRFGSSRHGHYRSWLILTQVVLVLILVALAAVDPVEHLPATLVLMVGVLLVSTFHDTAINGLAVRILSPADAGMANGIQVAAASLSLIIGSGGALLLYSHVGWTATVLSVTAVFAVPLIVLARFVEPPAPRGAGRAAPWRALASYFRIRRNAVWTLLVIPFFLLGDWLASAPQSAMLLSAGWSTDQIGFVQYTLATGAQIVAALVTGTIITRYGRSRPMVVIGIGSAVALAATLPLAFGNGHVGLTSTALILMAITYGAKLTWISTVSLDLARGASGATDYTVPVSMTGLGRVVLTSVGLSTAGLVGYPWLVGLSVVFALLSTGVAAAVVRGYPGAPRETVSAAAGSTERVGTRSGDPTSP
ncbi:Na+/melibiose symporter [Streptoalloteichus tenebrarius]|uniref:Na+/melibiose symporter n=1 Tax=Streptoalloteichus tenebrarius (strain ATCC 17920 / DSM 40477 / JCM 4838 / CBS 697.72 / NBRC 16177 / NCIMB 11028 / NRRL B-12390 / A12253. 1 / ISP 5477) TaxID=1933 RepID=A0ABT1HLL4_STRSD|nr:MFS transporter [Streptoalloteichus tenebrarius]MCP2256388.1 Na+/melibiose symporter [Streptoalloteichus tenebrarius]BFF04733.1 MFS transporter [Streptoalloteichus tenebrarius]